MPSKADAPFSGRSTIPPTSGPSVVRLAGGVAALIALAALLAFLPFTQAVMLSAGAVGLFLCLRWPWLIWIPLAALLPFTSAIHLGPASATDLLLAAAVALWFFDGARRHQLPLAGSPILLVVALYVVVMTASAFGATNLGEAAREVIKWAELLFFLLIASAMLDLQRAQWVAAAAVAGATAQAALGLYQFIFGIGPEFFIVLGRFMRAYGTFGQPNPFAGYLGLVLPVALSLALWGWQQVTSARRQRWAAPMHRWQALAWALFYSAATLLIAAGILASWSRGAWLGAACGVLVVLVLRSRTAALLSGAALLIVLAALLLGAFTPDVIPKPIAARMQDVPAYFGLTDILSEPLTDENFSVVERLAHWVAAQRMWERAPWLGVGPGNYATIYPEVRLPKWEDALGHAHNVYLNVLAETGLLGFAAYIGLMVTALVWTWGRARKAARSGSDDGHWLAALAVGVVGVLVHLNVHNIVDNLYVQGIVLQVGLWLALVGLKFDGEKSVERLAVNRVERI